MKKAQFSRNRFKFLRQQIPLPLAPSARQPILTASAASDGEGAAVLRLVQDNPPKDPVRAIPDAAGPDHRVPSQVRRATTPGSLRTKYRRLSNERELAEEYDAPVAGRALGKATTTRRRSRARI